MNEKETALLQEATRGETPLLCLRTKTKVDAGRWWWPTSVWVSVTQNEVILLAVARRRYLERVPVTACSESSYCAATGEVLLAPVEGLEVSRLALSPAEALQVLQVLRVRS